MRTCEYSGIAFSEPRSHPWSRSQADPEAQYYDLTRAPHLIRTSLEDFLPWAHYAAVEDFYRLLEWLNGSLSVLETNDCAFSPPELNPAPTLGKASECSGRVMLLFRAIARNALPGQVEQLTERLHRELSARDPAFDGGIIGTTLVPVRYLALPESDAQQAGQQLLISFWAWDDTEAENMLNLSRVFQNLTQALRAVCRGLGSGG